MTEIVPQNINPVQVPAQEPVPIQQKEFVMQNRSAEMTHRAMVEGRSQYNTDFQNQNLLHRWGMRAMEDYYIYRNAGRLRGLKVENNNAFATMSVVQEVAAEHGRRGAQPVGASVNPDMNRAQYEVEGVSAVERVRGEYQQLLSGKAMTQEAQEVVAAGGVVKNEIMHNLINNVTAATTPVDMRIKMELFTEDFIERCSNPRDALYTHRNDPDVQNFIQRFGAESQTLQSLAEGSADVFTAPEVFLDLAKEVKADMAAHNLAIEDMDQYVTIVLSNPQWAQATETQLTWRDRFVSRTQQIPGVARVLTPQSAAAIASIAGFAGSRLASSQSRRLATSVSQSAGIGWGVGTVIGTGLAAVRRNYEVKKDITAHRSALAYKEKQAPQQSVQQRQRRGLGRLVQRGLEWTVSRPPVRNMIAWGEAQRQERLAATVYDMASVNQLINGGGEQLIYSEAERTVAANKRESIQDLTANVSTSQESIDAAARRAGEIIARLDLYTHGVAERHGIAGKERQVRKDVIQWEKRGSEEQEKQRLNQGLQDLREALIAQGGLSADQVTDRVNTFRDNWRGVLGQDIIEKDLEARHHQVVESMFAAGYSVLGSATFGVISHEAVQGAVAAVNFGRENAPGLGMAAHAAIQDVTATANSVREHIPILKEHIPAFGVSTNDNLAQELATSAHDHHEIVVGNLAMHVDAHQQVIFDKLGNYHGAVPKIEMQNGHLVVMDNLQDPKFKGFTDALPKGFSPQEHYASAALQQGIHENPISPIGSVPAGAEHINIPANTHWVLDKQGHYNLVTKDGTSLIQNAHADGGHLTGDVVNHDLVNIDPQGSLDQKIATSDFLEQNKAKIDGWQWYGNNTQGSDFDELKLYDTKVSPTAIKLNMLSMDNSWQNGDFPSNVHVPDVIAQNKAVFTFWNKDTMNAPLIVRAEHGQLLLDKNDWKNSVQLWNGHDWVEKPNAQVANLVVGDINSGYESASNYSGHTEALNFDVSSGSIDGNTMNSYATALGTGAPPHDIPTPIDLITAKPQTPETWIVPVTPGVSKAGFAPIPQSFDFDLAIPVPVGPRHIPERGKKDPDEEVINFLDYYGYYGEPNVHVSEWLKKHKSPTLERSPLAHLDPLQEEKLYFERQSSQHMQEVQSLAAQIAEPPSSNLRAVVCIPVAGHQEGKNIYASLENYISQKAPKDQFELLLFVNYPEVDREGKPIAPDDTIQEIDRFRQDHPDFPVRVIQKVLKSSEAKIGTIRKYLNDVALYRHYQQQVQGENLQDVLLISNDADNKGVAPTYISNFISRFDAHLDVDGYVGQLDWDAESYTQYPLVHIGTRLFQYQNIIERRRKGWVVSSGANFAFKGSIYAGVGGYIEGVSGAEDTSLGQAIAEARGSTDRLHYAGNRVSRVYTSARRAIKALEEGLAPVEQWDMGFSAYDDEIRKLQLGTEQNINFDNPAEVDTLKNNIATLIERTYYGKYNKNKNDSLDFHSSAARLGIEYQMVNGKVTIPNIDKLVRRLKYYQQTGLLVKDLKAGKGNAAEIRANLAQLRQAYQQQIRANP